MIYDSQIHHRKSIRLQGYDYSQAGLYFITMCCQNRECLFGNVVDNKMNLNDAGEMVNQIWLDIPNQHHNANLHEYIIMPNHFHAIIEIIAVVGAESISAQLESVSGLEKIISDENLDRDAAYEFIENAFRDGSVVTTGTAITKVLPPVSRFSQTGERTKKRESVLEKLTGFFERFFNVSNGRV